MRNAFDVACTIALAAPLGVAAALLIVVAAGERLGATPFAGVVPANSAEAAGMASAADVLRFLRPGEDPNRVYPVRPEIISSAVRRATTLEAAMWSRQVELMQLLDREGAIVGPDQRARPRVPRRRSRRGRRGRVPGAGRRRAVSSLAQAFNRVLARTSGGGAAQ